MVTKINDSKLKANNLPFHLFRVHVRVLAEWATRKPWTLGRSRELIQSTRSLNESETTQKKSMRR